MASGGRRDRYYVARRAVSNGAVYSFSALVYLLIVFALELRFPARYVFSPRDQWRVPFLFLSIISFVVLLFGVLSQCAVRILGRRRGHLLSLPPMARPGLVFSLLWIAAGLAGAVAGAIFVFLGMQQRYRVTPSYYDGNAVLYLWVFPLLAGALPAGVYAVMTIAMIFAAVRALRSVKSPSSRSSRSRSRTRTNTDQDASSRVLGSVPGPDGFTDDNGRPYGNIALSDAELAHNGIQVPRPPPPFVPPEMQSSAPIPQPPSSREIDEMIATLNSMGFPSKSQNYAALKASNFDIQAATQRLLNAQESQPSQGASSILPYRGSSQTSVGAPNVDRSGDAHVALVAEARAMLEAPSSPPPPPPPPPPPMPPRKWR